MSRCPPDFCPDYTLTSSLETVTAQLLGYLNQQADHVYVVSVPIRELPLCKKFIVGILGKDGTAFPAMDHLRVGCWEFSIYFLCMAIFHVYLCSLLTFLVSIVARRAYQISWDWSYNCELLCRCWESKLDPLEEEPML